MTRSMLPETLLVDDDDRLITPREAMEVTGRSYQALAHLRHYGTGPAFAKLPPVRGYTKGRKRDTLHVIYSYKRCLQWMQSRGIQYETRLPEPVKGNAS